MKTIRFKNWWFFAMNGGIFLLFGLLILFFTEEFIKTLLIYFGMVMLAGGAVLLLTGINKLRRDKAGAMMLVESIVAVAIGIALIFFPEASVALFLIMIGIWSIIIGIVQLVVLINAQGVVAKKNLFLVNGLLTIALGIVLLFNPFQWAIFLVKLTGALAALFGLLLLWFSLVLRRIKIPENTADKA